MELIIFQIIVLVFSVVIHEVSHGIVADKLGDPTARLAGRLTLNPLKHLDPFGSVILPLMLALLPGSFMVGWAKPVPYNPENLKNPERGAALIAGAGPLSNLILALIFGLLFRIIMALNLNIFWLANLATLFTVIVGINIALALFNLIPIPPLDGSKLLFAILPKKTYVVRQLLEQYGFFILLAILFIGIGFLEPIFIFLYRIILGI